MIWNDLADELVNSFSMGKLNSTIIENELNKILPGEYKELFSPSSAMRYALVYSHSDYPLRSNELYWLKYSPQVFSYKLKDEIRAFFVVVSSDEEDYYIPCAAIIKIFNRVFDGKNVFLFRYSGSFSIGSARELSSVIPNNFAVTGPINSETIDEYDGFFDELLSCGFSELPQLFIQYSPQEQMPIKNYDDSLYDDYNYLSAIEEFGRNYGVTINVHSSFEEDKQLQSSFMDTYREACRVLSNVVDNIDPSYYDEFELVLPEEDFDDDLDDLFDTLDEDQEMEDDEDEYQYDETEDYSDIIADYSEEAFKSADVMLAEMSRKKKNGGAI